MLLLETLIACLAMLPNQGTVVYTADGEGRLSACSTCTNAEGLGGLGRRATLIREQRENGALLLLDAGNALFGVESAARKGRTVAEAYTSMGYDVMNFSHRDFRWGLEHTLHLVEELGLPAVSANLYSEEGLALFPAWLVRELGDTKVAIVGVTEQPIGLTVLPHLNRQLAGVVIADPVEALIKALPQAREQAERVCVLAYGSVEFSDNLRAALRENPVEGLFLGGAGDGLSNGEPVQTAKTDEGVWVQTGGRGGRYVIRCDLDNSQASALSLSSGISSDLGVEAIVNAEALAREDRKAKARATRPVEPVRVPEGSLQSGSFHRLSLGSGELGAGSGVHVSIQSLEVRDDWLGAPAQEGRAWLILGAQFANDLSLTAAFSGEREAGERVLVALKQHLFLLIESENAGEALPPSFLSKRESDWLPASFVLGGLGAKAEGRLAFDVPANLAGALELRYYPDEFGPLKIQLRGSLESTEAEPAQGNSIVELATPMVSFPEHVGGQAAPAGATWVSVSLLGRSLQKGPLFAQPAHYLESASHLQLVTDKVWARTRERGYGLSDVDPVFLPNQWTNNRVVFLAPERRSSLDLVCEFPVLSGVGEQRMLPSRLHFVLEGASSDDTPEGVSAFELEDQPLALQVLEVTTSQELDTLSAPASGTLLVLDCRIANQGPEAGLYRPAGRFASDVGRSLGVLDSLNPELPPEMGAELLLPAGETRAFRLAMEVPDFSGAAEVSYAGVGRAGSFSIELDPTGEAVRIEANAAPTSPAPEATPSNPLAVLRQQAIDTGLEPKGLEGVGLTPQQVNRAIDRASDALWPLLRDEILDGEIERLGSHQGHYLCLLALVHAGYHERNPEFDAALRSAIELIGTSGRWPASYHNYGIGLQAMLIEAYAQSEYLPRLELVAQVLIERQLSDGTWVYAGKVSDEATSSEAKAPLTVLGGIPLDGSTPQKTSLVRKGDISEKLGGDNSVTQFALLGLHAAARSGLQVPEAAWQGTLETTKARQNLGSGAWGYTTGRGYQSLTAAGVCALAVTRYHLGLAPDHSPEGADLHMGAGLGWLADNFSVTTNTKSNSWNKYSLYSLERVGRILDTEFIGKHEWYPLGAKHLVSSQSSLGFWLETDMGGGEPWKQLVGTSFGLLFLTRATPKLEDPNDPSALERGGLGLLSMRSTARVGRPLMLVLDCSGSMLTKLGSSTKLELAKDALRGIVGELPDESSVGMIAYGHRKRATEKDADRDVELLFQPQALGSLRGPFQERLVGLRGRGKTPLALSLAEAGSALSRLRSEEAGLVVLLTDGGQGREPGDPIEAARELSEAGQELRIIGFDIDAARTAKAWHAQLESMAVAAGGHYLPVGEALDLGTAVRSAVLQLPADFELFDSEGGLVQQGLFGGSLELKEGAYTFRTQYDGRPLEVDLWINTDRTTTVLFDLNGFAVAGQDLGDE